MAAAALKLVTVICTYPARDRVLDGLRNHGARGWSTWNVEGFGRHGHIPAGLFEGENAIVSVVVTAAAAAAILTWVETDLAKSSPCIAYSVDVQAVPGDHFA